MSGGARLSAAFRGAEPRGRQAWIDFARRLPKVELHVHLEGSMRPATLLALARRRRVSLPAEDAAGLAEWFRFRSFEHFVEVYLTCSRCLRDPEDFQRLVLDFLEGQAEQNVLYSEVHFTISTHVTNGANASEVAEAMAEAMAEGARRHGSRMRLIPDIVRNLGGREADVTLEWALEHRQRGGIAALGLAGIEEPAVPFEEHFRVAAAEGLHRVAHAGEQRGPESIRETLAHCAPERLGHGIRAIEDPGLVELLAERGIPLEICPTSNLRLGYAESPAAHPFDRLRRAGIEVSIGSDDPPFFGTTLSEEYALVAETFSYRRTDLADLAAAALAQAFVGGEERAALEAEMSTRLAELTESGF